MTTVWIAFSGFSPCLRESPTLHRLTADDCSQVAQEQSYLRTESSLVNLAAL